MASRREFLMHCAAAGVAVATSARSWATPTRVTGTVVETVTGPLDVSKLGFTLSHEHICACTPDYWQKWSGPLGGRAGLVARIVESLKAVKAEGVDTLVDLSPYDVGRDIGLIAEVSRKSGMQIVACTGQHLYPPAALANRTTEELTEYFTREIERGIDDTDIKAGVIKVATDRDGVTAEIEKALRAAARASKATRVPIATHTHARLRMGERQAEIFEAEGVNPAMVCLGHSDDSGDMDYLMGLAKRGYCLGMDHINRGLKRDAQVPWQKRAECIKQLIDAGLVNQIFLSNDVVLGAALLPVEGQGEREKNNPDGMLFSSRRLIPWLRENGVSAQAIRAMTVENPGRFFGVHRS
ncbi:MAG TPA: phosphotriesterase-related protein [Steroidobacteraceae bacterium]|nr:phosphotriesterase-related protein [Steroidobacteraceae bacterium]